MVLSSLVGAVVKAEMQPKRPLAVWSQGAEGFKNAGLII